MLSFRSNSQFPQFFIHMFHIGRNSLADGTKIVVIQFLTLRRHSTKKCTPSKHQVFSLTEFFLTYQKIFLFCSNRWYHSFCRSITKQTNKPQCLSVNGLHGTEKWCFLIQCFSCIGTKGCRNTQSCTCCIMTHKCRRRTVPCSITPCLKSSPKSSGRK